MDRDTSPDIDLKTLIADHMEAGFLENIIDMFRHDSGLYTLIGGLIQDERVRVRVGITALMEELKKLDADNINKALPSIIPLVSNDNPVVRGDIANLLAIIKDNSTLTYLERLTTDENPDVRLIAAEGIEGIKADQSIPL